MKTKLEIESPEDATMIWTPDEVWLQTRSAGGAWQFSGCGRLSLESVAEFCRKRGIDLVVYHGRGLTRVCLNDPPKQQPCHST